MVLLGKQFIQQFDNKAIGCVEDEEIGMSMVSYDLFSDGGEEQ